MASVLTGATLGQLARWRSDLGSQGPLLEPAHRDSRRHLYSFEDVVALRGYVLLRQQTSLQRIRKAVQYLKETHPDTHLSSHLLKVAPGGRTIVWMSDDGEYVDVVERPGQQGIRVVMQAIFGEFETDSGRVVPDLSEPAPGLSIDIDTRAGFPVLAGTRLPFNTISSLSRDGVRDEDIIEMYPSATPRGIAGANQFAKLIELNAAVA